MATIGLQVVSPVHGAVVVGPQPLSFVAVLSDGPHTDTLYARWYSSLPSTAGPAPMPSRPPTTADLDKLALHPQVGLPAPSTSLSFAAAPLVGSQAITVAVKDRVGDDEAALKTVQSGGTAGGGPGSPAPCVIHVLIAHSRVPAAPAVAGAAVIANRKDGLWAEGPPTWGSPAYAAVNQLRYRWAFKPRPSGQEIVVDATPAQLAFQERKDAEPPRVGHAQIPAAVPDGDYDLTLQVAFDPDVEAARTNPNVPVRKHEQSMPNVTVRTGP